MRVCILKALRAEARAWWYHAQLRRTGQHAEAARRERAAIRSDLQVLRECVREGSGAYVHCGRGGTTIHMRGSRLSSYSLLENWNTAMVAVALGTPLVDTRTVPEEKLVDLISVPMHDPGRAPDGDGELGWLSFVSLEDYASACAELGATVRNVP